jgi:hypothetical protein
MNKKIRTGRLLAAAVLALIAPMLAQALSSSRRTLVAELVLANRILANEGILDGYGHHGVQPRQRATQAGEEFAAGLRTLMGLLEIQAAAPGMNGLEALSSCATESYGWCW